MKGLGLSPLGLNNDQTAGDGSLSPMAYQGNVLWLRGDTVTPGSMSQWDDSSGNGNHWTQSNAGTRPTGTPNSVNNRNSVEFASGQSLVGPASLYGLTNGPNTWVVIFKSSSPATIQNILSGSNGGGTQLLIQQRSTEYRVRDGSTERTYTIGTDTNTHVLVLYGAPGQFYFYRDGVFGQTASATLNGTLTALGLGGIGNMCEVIAYNVLLPAAELNALCASRAAYWGASWTNIDQERVRTSMMGVPTTTSMKMISRLLVGFSTCRMAISTNENMAGATYSSTLTPVGDTITNEFTGLTPNTQYYVAVEVGGRLDMTKMCAFRTPSSGAMSYSYIHSCCNNTDTGTPPSRAVWDHIIAKNPLFYVHGGDFGYYDDSSTNAGNHRTRWLNQMSLAKVRDLMRKMPLAIQRDDHDSFGNNADGTFPNRNAANQAFRELMPFPLALSGTSDAVYYSFVIGRVRHILTDLRSDRSPNVTADGPGKLMMGLDQEDWLVAQCQASRNEGIYTNWHSTVAWGGTPVAGADIWQGFANQRNRIADRLQAIGMEGRMHLNIYDSHSIQMDTGLNGNFATSGSFNLPVFGAGAIENAGSTRGGPYDIGVSAGTGRYGQTRFVDTGGPTIDVQWEAYSDASASTPLFTHAFTSAAL